MNSDTTTTDIALPRSVRKGPLITIKCECGETRKLKYGEDWTCERCGRHWNTNKIPMEQYAAIRRAQMRYRRVPLVISAAALISVVAFIAIGQFARGLVIVALVATAYNVFARPMHKRKYQEALSKLPKWEIEPD